MENPDGDETYKKKRGGDFSRKRREYLQLEPGKRVGESSEGWGGMSLFIIFFIFYFIYFINKFIYLKK